MLLSAMIKAKAQWKALNVIILLLKNASVLVIK